tara:strand:+ start:411 stop:602 length:192 start_codon:yes stop_codon:yes gene_type:complete
MNTNEFFRFDFFSFFLWRKCGKCGKMWRKCGEMWRKCGEMWRNVEIVFFWFHILIKALMLLAV